LQYVAWGVQLTQEQWEQLKGTSTNVKQPKT
jgi:hypothetical protein